MTVALALVAVAVAVAAAGFAWWSRDGVLRRRTKRVALVTTRNGIAFRGVLMEHDRQALVLRDVQTPSADGPTPVDGEVVLLMSDVAYVQIL